MAENTESKTSETKEEIQNEESNSSLLGKRQQMEEKSEDTTNVEGEGTPIIPPVATQKYSSRIRRHAELKQHKKNILVSRPTTEIKGHTSFLLFARKSIN